MEIEEKKIENGEISPLDRGKLGLDPASTIAEVNNSETVMHRRGPVLKQGFEEVLEDGNRG